MSYTYDYPRPMVTADILLLRFCQEEIECLLIRRKNDPFAGKWALPGGFVEIDEDLLPGARRELREETGLADIPLFQLFAAGKPGRDPRGRTLTVLFGGILSPPYPQIKAGDDARRAEWFPIEKLPPLAFDHGEIISDALANLKHRLLWQLYVFLFMPEKYEIKDLEILCGKLLKRREWANLILEVGKELGWISESGGHLWKRNTDVSEILETGFKKLTESWLHILPR